jgi:ArsR family transcriptional regulator, arsenate/arsenite/antimonite-responsive transcriptional repressor
MTPAPSTAAARAGARDALPLLTACCTPVSSSIADSAADSLAGIFRALADPARVKIVSLLLNADEICACDVSTAIGKAAGTTSHHLRLLRDAGLITGDKRGTWIYYRLVPERLAAIADALKLAG